MCWIAPFSGLLKLRDGKQERQPRMKVARRDGQTKRNSHVVEVTPDSISNSSPTSLVLLRLNEPLDALPVGAEWRKAK